jgi:cyanophycinase
MRGCLSAIIVMAVSIAGMVSPSQAEPGRLVIGGGAVSPDNAEVWQALIAGLPDPEHDTIAVIAAASGEPVASFESFRDTMAGYGVDRSRIVLIRAAIIDDDTTSEDESLWASGGTDPVNLATIQAAGGIWFTGGDQARTAQVMFDDQGAPTPLLQAVRQRLDQGAVVGGSSAGAAIQPEIMIVRGDGLTALLDPVPSVPSPDDMETGALILAPGAGFFRFGLIDQHFDRQARLGRLVRATLRSEAHRFGYGIDENTALIVDSAQSEARVVGKGGVTVIDDVDAEQTGSPNDFPASGLRLSLAASGDQIDLATGRVTPAPFRTAVSMPRPDDTEPRLVGQGALVPSGTFVERIDADLIGGRSASIRLWTVGPDRRAVELRLTRQPETRAWFGSAEDGDGGMTVESLDLAITPGRVQFDAVQP